jgi:hypothetical protein
VPDTVTGLVTRTPLAGVSTVIAGTVWVGLGVGTGAADAVGVAVTDGTAVAVADVADGTGVAGWLPAGRAWLVREAAGDAGELAELAGRSGTVGAFPSAPDWPAAQPASSPSVAIIPVPTIVVDRRFMMAS